MNAPLALTLGEPAGIGPDLAVLWAQRDRAVPWWRWRIRACSRRGHANSACRWTIVPYPAPSRARTLGPDNCARLATWSRDSLDVANVPWVLATLTEATDGCLEGAFCRFRHGVRCRNRSSTTPVSRFGPPSFWPSVAGETVVSCCLVDLLRVALATTHVPLSAVPALITRARLTQVWTCCSRI